VLALDQNIWFGIAGGLLLACCSRCRLFGCGASNSARKSSLLRTQPPALLRKLKGTRAQSKRGRDTGQGQSHKRKNGFREGGARDPARNSSVRKRLVSKEEALDKRVDSVEKRDSDLGRREAAIKSREKSIEDKSVECGSPS